MLFGNESFFLLDRSNKNLLIGNDHGIVLKGLEQGHYVICGAIFTLVLEDVLSISRLRVVVCDILYVFLKTGF